MILEFIRWILGVKVITAHTKETVAKDWQEIETLLKVMRKNLKIKLYLFNNLLV